MSGVSPAPVIPERTGKVERDRLRVELRECGQLVLEAPELGVRRRPEVVWDQVAIRKREVHDRPLQRGCKPAHLTNPGVLQGMMLGLDQHMKAEHGFEERRVRM
jgi:hypothetical protein